MMTWNLLNFFYGSKYGFNKDKNTHNYALISYIEANGIEILFAQKDSRLDQEINPIKKKLYEYILVFFSFFEKKLNFSLLNSNSVDSYKSAYSLTQLLNTYGFNDIHIEKLRKFDLALLDTYCILSIIKKFGIEKSSLLKKKGYNLNNFGNHCTLDIFKTFGLEVASTLKDYNLSGYAITELIKTYGLNSLPKLEKLGDLDKLGGENILDLVNHLGMQVLYKLKEHNIDLNAKLNGFHILNMMKIKRCGLSIFSDLSSLGVELHEKLNSDNIVEIITNFGINSIKELKKQKIDLAKLKGFYIALIIKKFGSNSISYLRDYGINLDLLNGYDITGIIKNSGIDSIKELKNQGVDINNLEGDNIVDIIKTYGIDSISELRNQKIDLGKKLKGSDLASIIKFFGIHSLYELKKQDIDIDRMKSEDIKSIIEAYGIDVLPILKNKNIPLSSLTKNDIMHIINIYGVTAWSEFKNQGMDLSNLSYYCTGDRADVNLNSSIYSMVYSNDDIYELREYVGCSLLIENS